MSVAARTARALRHPPNWIQLAKFGIVGLSGFAINFGIYDALLGIGAHKAAAISFVVSASRGMPQLFVPPALQLESI